MSKENLKYVDTAKLFPFFIETYVNQGLPIVFLMVKREKIRA